jgi:hypothetical protein
MPGIAQAVNLIAVDAVVCYGQHRACIKGKTRAGNF